MKCVVGEAMAKHKCEGDNDDSLVPSDILEASPKAMVQYRVTCLSEMKKSKDKSYL